MISTGALTATATSVTNASTNNHARTLTPPQSINFTPIRRPNIGFLCNPSFWRFSPVTAVTGQHHPNGVSVGVKELEEEKSLAERLRLGSLTEDGLSYKERFVIRCFEVGINKTATVETIANLLQGKKLTRFINIPNECLGFSRLLSCESVFATNVVDEGKAIADQPYVHHKEVGGNHAQSVGFSTDGFATTTTMRKLHLIWVTARMHIEIYRYPAWSDVVEIETWCQSEGRIGTRRDWILKDYANGEVIGRATSKWVMMNEDTRRLQKVSDDVRDEYLIFCPKILRLAFPEENNNSLKKIGKLEDPAEYSRLGLVPRRADLDMNKHVNNVTYIGWVLESIPQEVIDTHELQSITLDYRRECQHDDIVDSLTTPEPICDLSKDGDDLSKFLHLLKSSGDGLEINRGRTEWRKKLLKR